MKIEGETWIDVGRSFQMVSVVNTKEQRPKAKCTRRTCRRCLSEERFIEYNVYLCVGEFPSGSSGHVILQLLDCFGANNHR